MIDTSYHEQRLAQRMNDAEFKAAFDRSRAQISQIDSIIQELEALRAQAGVSKAELARQIGRDPASVRRLFTAKAKNPELKTVAALASALDAEIQIVPKRKTKRARRRSVAAA